MTHRNAFPSNWNIKSEKKKIFRFPDLAGNKEGHKNILPLTEFPKLSGSEGRYLTDRAFNNAERINPYEYEWRRKNTDGSVEVHRERGVRIDLQKSDVQRFTRKIIEDNRPLFNRLANV